MVILPSAYLPSISYFARLLQGEQVVIDIGEHYIKRSIRNRTTIVSAQGEMTLTVPIVGANTPRRAMHTVEIDYSKRWQHQHWQAIISAYRSAPYFDHYAPYFENFYSTRWESLTDFNKAIFDQLLSLLCMGQCSLPPIEVSSEYLCATPCDIDLRSKGGVERGVEHSDYIQVFSDRLPFYPNASLLDLLFCEGPCSLELLGNTHFTNDTPTPCRG